MKKYLQKLCTVLLFFCVCSCGLSSCVGAPGTDGNGLHIAVTNFALYDFASAVCGEGDTVTMLLPPGAESHDYEVTLSDMAVLENCDLLVYVGGESEAWVYNALSTLEEHGKAPRTLSAMAVMDAENALYPEENAGSIAETEHNHDHTGEHNHDALSADTFAGMDEHIWTAIPHALTLMDAIADAIRQIDENHTHADYGAYAAALGDLHNRFLALTESTAEPRIIVADRFPFLYMAKAYGIGYYAAFAGCAADTEPSVAVVDTLIRQVQESGTDTLFVIEFSDRRTAELIAAQTGAEIKELHSCHNVSAADFAAGITYLDLMERNYAALAQAWE